MIKAVDLKEKLGERGFVDFVKNNRSTGDSLLDRERKRKWGRVKHKMCEHGIWIIEDYKEKTCSSCVKATHTKTPDFKPHFNLGLGCYVESKSDHKRAMKEAGAQPIGLERIRH